MRCSRGSPGSARPAPLGGRGRLGRARRPGRHDRVAGLRPALGLRRCGALVRVAPGVRACSRTARRTGRACTVLVEGEVADPALQTAVQETAERLRAVPDVGRVVTAYDAPLPTLRAPRTAAPSCSWCDLAADLDRAERRPRDRGRPRGDGGTGSRTAPPARSCVGGTPLVYRRDRRADRARTCSAASSSRLPLTLAVMVVVFGGFLAALDPAGRGHGLDRDGAQRVARVLLRHRARPDGRPGDDGARSRPRHRLRAPAGQPVPRGARARPRRRRGGRADERHRRAHHHVLRGHRHRVVVGAVPLRVDDLPRDRGRRGQRRRAGAGGGAHAHAGDARLVRAPDRGCHGPRAATTGAFSRLARWVQRRALPVALVAGARAAARSVCRSSTRDYQLSGREPAPRTRRSPGRSPTGSPRTSRAAACGRSPSWRVTRPRRPSPRRRTSCGPGRRSGAVGEPWWRSGRALHRGRPRREAGRRHARPRAGGPRRAPGVRRPRHRRGRGADRLRRRGRSTGHRWRSAIVALAHAACCCSS